MQTSFSIFAIMESKKSQVLEEFRPTFKQNKLIDKVIFSGEKYGIL